MTVKTPAVLKAQFLSTDPMDQNSDLIDSTLASAASMIPPGGTWFYVDGTNGSDANTGLTWTAPLKTITAALALTTTGKNDVVCVLAAAAGTAELTAIDWHHNLTHLIGLGAPTGISARTRIMCGAVDSGPVPMSPFFTVSGYGCIFSNLTFWQGQADASTLINVSVTGNRNYFNRVHFAGGGDAAQALDGGMSLNCAGSENVFVRCTIGVDTVVAAAGMANMYFDSYAARNTFEDCVFQIYAGATTVKHVEVADSAGIDRWNLFKRCMFINSCRTYTLAEVFTIPAAMASQTNYIILNDCFCVGATDWDTNDRGNVYLSNGTITGGGNSGLLLVAAKT
jgi:hypothetical protein